MRLILVRHGQTPSNVDALLDTDEPGAGLTELGRTQAAALVHALGHEPVEAVHASTLVRTQQTAAPLAAALGLEVQVHAGLREVAAGDLEMRGDHDAVRTYLTTVFAWSAGHLDRRMPGGESGHEVYARFDAALGEVTTNGGTAVVVSHGAIIRSWCAARVENVTLEHAERRPLANTGVVVLEGGPTTGWTALTWEGHPLGGPGVDQPGTEGPAGEPFLDVDQQAADE